MNANEGGLLNHDDITYTRNLVGIPNNSFPLKRCIDLNWLFFKIRENNYSNVPKIRELLTYFQVQCQVEI